MVEIMSQGSRQEILKLPKNIRQIGLPEEKKKIYVEDYVVTYMNQLASEHSNEQSAAILLGFYSKQKDVKLTFIHGAIGIPAAKVDEDSISFSSDIWEEIYNAISQALIISCTKTNQHQTCHIPHRSVTYNLVDIWLFL